MDGIDLDIEQGEMFALLGPNGAGKNDGGDPRGLPHRDAGEIDVLGEDPQRAAGWRTRIGIVLQDSKDYAELTVLEVLHHFAAYYPDPRARTR